MNNSKPFGQRDKISYMAGDIANDLTFLMATFFLMLFYTDVLKIEGTVVGILFLVARFVDAFTDVGMGRLLDTFKPAKDGRFRCWIRRISPFVCLSGFLLFLHVVKDLPYAVKVVYIFVTYIMWGSFFYTAINIPYGSMAAVVGTQPEDRAALSVYRTLGGNIAALTIAFGVPLLVYRHVLDDAGHAVLNAKGQPLMQIIPEMFTVIAGVFVIIAFFLYRFCYKNTVERVQLDMAVRKHDSCFSDVKAIFASLVTNKALMLFIGVAIMIIIGTFVISAMNPYLYTTYFNSKQGLSIAGIIGPCAVFVMAPFAQRIVKRFGKKESAAVGALFTGLVFLALYFMKEENVYVFLLISFIALLGVNYLMLIIWAFVTDIIDNQYLITDKREDGTIYAMYSFARKAGQAFAGFIGGFTLTFVGYQPGVLQQSEQTLSQIYSVATLAPALACIVAFLILQFLYPLSKSVVDKNTAELERRRAKNS